MATATESNTDGRVVRSPRRAWVSRNIDPLSAILGSLLDADTGHPVGGLEVTAHVKTPAEADPRRPTADVETLVGSGFSDYRGRFEIVFLDDAAVKAALGQLDGDRSVRLVLRVHPSSRGTPYLESDPIVLDATDPVTLLVPLPKQEPGPATWTRLADAMEEAGLTRACDLVRELVAVPAEISPFADMTVEARHEAAWALELAFLDPDGMLRRIAPVPTFHAVRFRDGDTDLLEALSAQPQLDPAVDDAAATAFARLTSFSGMLEVDWQPDADSMRRGEPGPALNLGQPPTAAQVAESLSLGTFDPLKAATPVDQDLVGYRNYLRAIVTGGPGANGGRESSLRLASRFHQDFSTRDTTSRSVNAVLVPIMKAILTAAKGAGYGFGVGDSAITPQGESSHRDYLDHLIGLSGTSAHMLELRYRIRLDHPDSALSSAVQQNIDTLQGFLQDGFQSSPDPHDPIIPAELLGTAPFFLRYDEWRAVHAPFHAENHFPMKESYTTRIDPDDLEKAINSSDDDEWFVLRLEAHAMLYTGHEHMRNGQFESARAAYLEARSLAGSALYNAPGSRAAEDAGMKNVPLESVLAELIGKIQTIDASSPEGMQALLDAVASRFYFNWPMVGETNPTHSFHYWLKQTYPDHVLALVRLAIFIVPTCLGDLAVAEGEYETAIDLFAEATRFLVATAGITDETGWVQPVTGGHMNFPSLLSPTNMFNGPASWRAYRGGGLPYTADIATDHEAVYAHVQDLAYRFAAVVAHPIEQKYLKLHYADAILAWADSLYRTDNAANIERARELYKAVLFLHGFKPAISPSWPAGGGRFVGSWQAAVPARTTPAPATRNTLQTGKFVLAASGGTPVAAPAKKPWHASAGSLAQYGSLITAVHNPARVAQIQHASRCLLQIRSGLNVHGLSEAHVPAVRYTPLKDAADRFTADAKAAQSDLITYIGKVEDALQAVIINSHMLEKAQIQASIAEEQKALAQYAVGLAQQQVQAIENEIDAKRKELKEEKEFFNQLTTFIGGMKTAVEELPDDLVGTGKSGLTGAAGIGSYQAVGNYSWMGAGAGAMTGYGLFVYAGFTSMQAMGDAWNSLAGQIKHLENEMLPLARAEVAARQRQVTIAGLEQKVALSDAQLAQELISFASTRFLDLDFWSQMAALSRRLLRRYLQLATAHAWLAERALAYEQDRSIRIIRFDYFPQKLQGIGGADQLRADLAELEASRIAGMQATVPITRVHSLAFDSPLQFAQLKQTGRCTFPTSDLPYTLAHPGTYGHRLRAVTVRVMTYDGVRQPHGLLSNPGAGTVRRRDGTASLSLRPADALPVSGFQLRRDIDVFGLPGETLMTFEGSPVNTLWTLELPAAGNPNGLDGLLDVELVFDIRALYSPALQFADQQAAPKAVMRSGLFSAAHHDPAALDRLGEQTGPVTLEFDLAAVLPSAESSRTLTNLVLVVAGATGMTGPATLACDSLPTPVSFDLAEGIALSNCPPLATAADPQSPLNQFAGVDPGQKFRATFDAANFPGGDITLVRDVLLMVEYGAQV